MIVPTGVGCSIGGYAGDAIPSARLLAAASGCLITHPNVMNAAALYWNDIRIHYVEGYALDRFAAGEMLLKTVRQQKIGLLLDSAIEKDLYHRHLQVANACKASLGLNIGPIVTTELPVEISLIQGKSGSSWGGIGQPASLLRAGEKLKELGATAIAVITRFPEASHDEMFEAYRLGRGVDALAGAEAVISHLLVKHLLLPCAHAPALSPLPLDLDLDPRAAAEDIGYTFLSSVLVGLSRAPDLIKLSANKTIDNIEFSSANYIKSNDLGAVVVPEGALGGPAVLACLERGIPLIAVENPSALNVSSELLGVKNLLNSTKIRNFLKVKNYLEAAGIVLSIREGIDVSCLQRPIRRVL
tara:strand:+ start:46521 stop:47591 length:1071 start_codon:yes stop_codon:yes gene_type:complete